MVVAERLPSTRTEPAATSVTIQSAAAFEPHQDGVGFAFPPLVGDANWEPWVEYAQYRIKESFRLEANWDFEGAEPVTHDAAQFANTIARRLNRDRVARPFISGTPEGAIGFEWSGGSVDLFLTVHGTHLEVAVRDPESGEFHEGRPAEVAEPLDRALALLVN